MANNSGNALLEILAQESTIIIKQKIELTNVIMNIDIANEYEVMVSVCGCVEMYCFEGKCVCVEMCCGEGMRGRCMGMCMKVHECVCVCMRVRVGKCVCEGACVYVWVCGYALLKRIYLY